MRIEPDTVLTFGKFKGQRILDVPDSYVDWLSKQEFISMNYRQIRTARAEFGNFNLQDELTENDVDYKRHVKIKEIIEGTELTYKEGKEILDNKILTIINKKGNPSIEDWD